MYIRKTKVTKEIRKHTNKRKVTMTQRWLFEKKINRKETFISTTRGKWWLLKLERVEDVSQL